MSNAFDADLDVRGLNCPLPILKTKKQLVVMEPGELLRVRATDPHSVIDFMAFCEKTGNDLVEHSEQDGEYHFLLRRKSD
ncbi:preprotein translocase subunit TatC [Alkalilimnicola ehrlichii]|uniref:Preprotein translocase subunit TatC n=1 Tax=Alkalilimnicola ehrlichii TaxID=351052 RepID=A0A3E0X3B3_9GAMM|nr:sulfurtransferase TusA family protein [Alkalilimnicola ehrlichii]RFA31189.1 preprotein translocase subunit TatC [Alkalilimnicola ehrlichii]RFA39528.1 preprotein translocase subunit TatC [Alkalilimnicola ehrlichii]